MSNRWCAKCNKSVPKGRHYCGAVKKEQHPNSSTKMQKLRLQILARDEGECVRCRVLYDVWTPDMPGSPLFMHHIKNQKQYKLLRAEPTNLIMLCKDCHDVYDNGKINELGFDYDFPEI